MPVDQDGYFGIIVFKLIAGIVIHDDINKAMIDAVLHKRGNIRTHMIKTTVINSVTIECVDNQIVVGKLVLVVDTDSGGVLLHGHAGPGRRHLYIDMLDIGHFCRRNRQAHGREHTQHHGKGQQ